MNKFTQSSISASPFIPISFSTREFICEVQINYPTAATKIVHDGIQMKETWNHLTMPKRKFLTVFDVSVWKTWRTRERERTDRNYLMMFEFEKIELIDGRWKEEIDQIRFWLNVDYHLRESNLLNKQQMIFPSWQWWDNETIGGF